MIKRFTNISKIPKHYGNTPCTFTDTIASEMWGMKLSSDI